MSTSDTLVQDQSARAESRKLSLHPTIPPGEVPGVRLARFLGAGAFGQVWVGRDLNTGRDVAVKFYLHRGGVNWSLLSHEVKNLVQLSADRHVVQVLEVGWEAAPPYYVMEWIEGGSLETRLAGGRRLPVGESIKMFRSICTGLNHCHGRGVLHCDVKPANILIAGDDEPRLADFGQSRMSHDQTPAMGTLFYMAPEQADLDSTPDARWDVYAAGAILHRMLTGTAPYRDPALINELDTAGSLPQRLSRYRLAIASAAPIGKTIAGQGFDRPLRRILAKCLAPAQADRYDNVQQILDDLDRRDAIRTRRPLMLLGIVGPLMLLLATCLFAARSIDGATEGATRALRDEAFGANRLAARFAARTLESQLLRSFARIEREAARPELLEAISRCLNDPAAAEPLAVISGSPTAAAANDQREAREWLLDDASRLAFDEYLTGRLTARDGGGTSTGRLATLFVTDSAGTMLAIAYGESVSRDQNSAGRNFAYRTYFHGGPDDLPPAVSLDDVGPLRDTQLSSAFQSTATGSWKVAISAPIYLDKQQSGKTQPDAVFVATINLGEFELLQRDDVHVSHDRSASQVAVLVEARQGPLRGTVLQHPLMADPVASDALAEKRFQVPGHVVDQLIDGGDLTYNDPLARAPGGERFAGQWLAAMQPVRVPEVAEESGASRSNTDLLVLVQYRLADILGPVDGLRRDLLAEGAAAVGSILLVTLVLWWFASRSGTDRHRDVEPAPSEPEATMTVG